MRYLIFILSLIYITPVKAQITWIGTVSDDHHHYLEPDQPSDIFILIRHTAETSQEAVLDSIEGHLTLSSIYVLAGKGEIEIKKSYMLVFQSGEDGLLLFKASIPAGGLIAGRYSIGAKFKNTFSNQVFQLSDFYPDAPVVTAGASGIVSATLVYAVEGVSPPKTYGLVCPENTVALLPLLLEGVYTHGFCSDELAGLHDFSVHLWLHKDIQDAKVFAVVRSEGNNVLIRKELNLHSIAAQGATLSDLFPNTFAINDPENIEDRFYVADELADDLLGLASNLAGVHELQFTIEMEQDGVVKNLLEYPVKTNYEIVEAPTGADCQAFLLPIEMVDFDIYEQKTQVFGYWVVALEVNCEYYLVEKSLDAWNWIPVQKEGSRGINGALTRYEFLDKNPWPGISYYRIRQVDVDGTLSYSKKKAVHIKSGKLRLYPNPVSDRLYYSIEDPDQRYEVKIFNDLGACVNQRSLPDPDQKEHTIELDDLPPGVYYIKYTNTQNYLSQVEKFIKL